MPNCATEILVHTRRHGLVVLTSNVFAYHLRVEEALTANAAMPLVAGEGVRTPLEAFRVVFGIGHFDRHGSWGLAIDTEGFQLRRVKAARQSQFRPRLT